MTTFTQRIPWQGFAKRTLTLAPDKLLINHKGFEDEYRYKDINPALQTVRRGESEWSNVIFGLIVAFAILFILTKIIPSVIFKLTVFALGFVVLIAAGWLFALQFIKKEHVAILDTSGDCILMLRVTPKSKPFITQLRAKLEEGRTKSP